MKRTELARYIEGTLVKNVHTEEEVKKCAEIAKQYHMGAMVTNPCYTKLIAEALHGSDVLTGGVSSFPWGAGTTEIKIAEAKRCILDGAQEIDTVMNLNALLSGDDRAVVEDIRAMKEAIGDIPLKVIIEAAQLNDDDLIRRAARLVVEGHADYVKTCTGFNGGSDVHMVQIIKETVGDSALIKAAAGIRTAEYAKQLIEAGASRLGIGFASAVEILDSMEE